MVMAWLDGPVACGVLKHMEVLHGLLDLVHDLLLLHPKYGWWWVGGGPWGAVVLLYGCQVPGIEAEICVYRRADSVIYSPNK